MKSLFECRNNFIDTVTVGVVGFTAAGGEYLVAACVLFGGIVVSVIGETYLKRGVQ